MPHPLDIALGILQSALFVGSLVVWMAIFVRLARGQEIVPYEPRLPVPWTGGDVAVLSALILLFDALAIVWLPSLGVDPKSVSVGQVVLLNAAHLVWLLIAFLYLSRKAGAYADDMGFDLRHLGYDLRLAGLAFLAAVVPVYGLQLLLTQAFGQESAHPLKKLVEAEPTTGVLLWATVAAVGVAPLVEEFILRVLLQGWLEKKHLEQREWRGGNPDRPAGFLPIAIAGAIFAMLHRWPDQVALFVLSLFLGYVYQRTHRIVAPLALHVIVNMLGVLQLWRTHFVGTPYDVTGP